MYFNLWTVQYGEMTIENVEFNLSSRQRDWYDGFKVFQRVKNRDFSGLLTVLLLFCSSLKAAPRYLDIYHIL